MNNIAGELVLRARTSCLAGVRRRGYSRQISGLNADHREFHWPNAILSRRTSWRITCLGQSSGAKWIWHKRRRHCEQFDTIPRSSETALHLAGVSVMKEVEASAKTTDFAVPISER
jgi:hypothetical protein